jgi:hypothetical protein
MEIGRRELLGGAVTLSLARLASSLGTSPPRDEMPVSMDHRWHPLTQSLLDRARRAGQRLDRPRVERIVHEVAEEHGRLIIKWMENPTRAFEHMSRYGLDELVQMGTARFWSAPRPFPVTDEGTAERSFELNWRATQLLRVDEHDRALMAPKLIAKARAMTTQSGPEAIFEARAVAAQIGWIETSLPTAAAQAVRAVEDLLSAGYAENSVAIYHQLRVFEAREHGLLATWETPDGLVCVPGFIFEQPPIEPARSLCL